MPLRPNMEFQEYLAILARRKWFAVFSILTIIFGASVYCVVVPEQFRSSTMILVVPQRVPDNYVHSTVSVKIEERLSTIQQQVLSRTRLKSVMDELGLFRQEQKKLPLEEVVEIMRKRISIEVRGSERNRDAFTLSFAHEEPRVAMLTASRLASFFIDENLKVREQQAVGTSEFLDSQMQETKKLLEEQEEKVRRYKMSFMGELPQQMQVNMQTLSRLQDQMKSNSDAVRSAEDRKVFLEAQASSLETQIDAVVSKATAEAAAVAAQPDVVVVEEAPPPVAPSDPNPQLSAEIAAKKARLADLTTRYTDRYPEVVRLQREIEVLEKRRAETPIPVPPPASKPVVRVVTPAPSPRSVPVLPTFQKEREEIIRLRTQSGGLGLEIASLRREREDLLKEVADVQAKVDRSPRREQEMIALTRDYENLKRSYDELLKKKLDADISQNLERRQKGEQFQVLDPANLPEEPFQPNRKKVFAFAIIGSLIVGLGGIAAIEKWDLTLHDAVEFKHFFDLPILATVPVLRDREYERKRLLRQSAVLGGLVVFIVAVMGFMLIYSDKIRQIVRL